MANLLVVILQDLSRLPDLLKAWKKIGVPGVTLVHSMGGFQAENWLEKIGLGGLNRLLDANEIRQRTIFTVISDDELLERAISEADAIVEGFDRPHSGILFTLPVGHMLGIRKRGHSVPTPAPAPPGLSADEQQMGRKTPVSRIVDILPLKPVTISATATLQEIADQMLAHPGVHVACVVNTEQRLIGLIDLMRLGNGFFFSVFPEKFLAELRDLDQVFKFASQTQVKLASDLMQEPAWVKMDDTLEDAFVRMHEQQIPGLPVIDDHYHILGYINLLELMGVCLPGTKQDNGEGC